MFLGNAKLAVMPAPAFLFRVEGALAGFALVFTGEPHDIAEFL
jgi:hypothetical protein